MPHTVEKAFHCAFAEGRDWLGSGYGDNKMEESYPNINPVLTIAE